MRLPFCDLAKRVVREKGGHTGCQRRDAMVHLLQNETVQVDEVAGDVDCRDLAASVGQQRIARGEALEEETALGRAVAFSDDVVVRADVLDMRNAILKNPFLLVREG